MSDATVWVDLLAAGLLILSGLIVLVSAVGFARLPDFFLRMHPPALAYTLGVWCVALAATLYFSLMEKRAALHPLLIPLLLAVTVPITTVLLARVSLFRARASAGSDVPPPLARLGAPASTPNGEKTGHAEG